VVVDLSLFLRYDDRRFYFCIPMKKRYFIFIFLLIVLVNPVQAAPIGQQVIFNVDSSYQAQGRNQSIATLREISQYAYFYVDNNYWNKILPARRQDILDSLKELGQEFDKVIYPKEREVFGSEWKPGIDNDERITVLIVELKEEAGGYWNAHDEYPRSLVPESNEREMVYLNALYITDPLAKSFLAHEFQHLITFYHKTKLFNLEEEVWLNEARSEYAPTLCGYDEEFPQSNLARRVDSFLDSPSDSLTEWRNQAPDYGVVSLFLHYLVEHYGEKVLTEMVRNNQVGIESINTALKKLGYSKTFSEIFADWLAANYLNNCQENSFYCYLNPNLNFRVDPTASYSGFPYLIVSRTSSIKDWSGHWYRFRPQDKIQNKKTTFKLEFRGSQSTGDFMVPYLTIDKDNQAQLNFIPLENQRGTVYIPNFGQIIKAVVMMPFNRYKKSNFTSNEFLTTFSFTAESIESTQPVIEKISPDYGLDLGGQEIAIQGENLSQIKEIVWGEEKIRNFQLISEKMIKLILPRHPAGQIKIKFVTQDNQVLDFSPTFEYLSSYPDGSLLRAKGDIKVYVIKNRYKRWLQSPEIFRFYGHLRWDRVIEVDPKIIQAYEESWLIRPAFDYRVYQVDSQKVRHWLDLTPRQFEAKGYNWSMIFIINEKEYNFYQAGTAIR